LAIVFEERLADILLSDTFPITEWLLPRLLDELSMVFRKYVSAKPRKKHCCESKFPHLLKNNPIIWS
jgi:hypothetical protein